MQIHQSAEDYLETILMLNQRMGRVRSIDVVNELGYTKASVSIAMKKLRANYDKYKITKDMIIGVVKFKIPLLGYPTVLLNEKW